MNRADRQALLLYIGVTVAVGFADFRVRPGNLQDYPVTQYIPGVLNGTYGAPADYRVLAPYVIDRFTRFTGTDPVLGFAITRLLFIFASLAAIHVYLRQWFTAAASAAGVLGVAALLPLTFTNGWANPDSFPELLLFTLGCALIARHRDGPFLLLLVLATLNRETAAFLVLLWGWYRVPDRWAGGDLVRLAGYGVVWSGLYAGIRWWRGFESYDLWMLWENLASLKLAPPGFDPYRRVFGFFWLILLLVPSAIAVAASRLPGTPRFFKRSLPVAAGFGVVCVLMSKTIEARIFTPMFPLLLPAVLRAFADPAEPQADTER